MITAWGFRLSHHNNKWRRNGIDYSTAGYCYFSVRLPQNAKIAKLRTKEPANLA